jgi:hypothetical protein
LTVPALEKLGLEQGIDWFAPAVLGEKAKGLVAVGDVKYPDGNQETR